MAKTAEAKSDSVTLSEIGSLVENALYSKIEHKLSPDASKLIAANEILVSLGNDPIDYPDTIKAEIEEFSRPNEEIRRVTQIIDDDLDRRSNALDGLKDELATLKIAISQKESEYRELEKIRRRLTGKTSIRLRSAPRMGSNGYTWLDYFNDSQGRTPSGNGGRNGSYGNENRLAQETMKEGHLTAERAKEAAIASGIIVAPQAEEKSE